MERRQALYNLGLITGLAFLSNIPLLSSCSGTSLKKQLDEDDVQLLNEIGEVIIPATNSSPGAKAADIGHFIQTMVKDCMKPDDREKFMQGWQYIQVLGKEKYRTDFMELDQATKLNYLNEMNTHEAIAADKEKSDLAIASFQKIKQLTVKGYFTSEPGATQALRYDPVPGKFIGVIPYKKGDKVWALTM